MIAYPFVAHDTIAIDVWVATLVQQLYRRAHMNLLRQLLARYTGSWSPCEVPNTMFGSPSEVLNIMFNTSSSEPATCRPRLSGPLLLAR
jgi:hypothetical protein